MLQKIVQVIGQPRVLNPVLLVVVPLVAWVMSYGIQNEDSSQGLLGVIGTLGALTGVILAVVVVHGFLAFYDNDTSRQGMAAYATTGVILLLVLAGTAGVVKRLADGHDDITPVVFFSTAFVFGYALSFFANLWVND